jgi:hypothetical protein
MMDEDYVEINLGVFLFIDFGVSLFKFELSFVILPVEGLPFMVQFF